MLKTINKQTNKQMSKIILTKIPTKQTKPTKTNKTQTFAHDCALTTSALVLLTIRAAVRKLYEEKYF